MMIRPIEARVLAHRYLYFVLNKPTISDWDYDELLKKARLHAHPEAMVHERAGRNTNDYPQVALDLAHWFLEDHMIVKP